MNPQKRNLIFVVAGVAALVASVVVLMPNDDGVDKPKPDPAAERNTHQVASQPTSPTDPAKTGGPAAKPNRPRPAAKPIGPVTRERGRATCTVLVNSMRNARLSPQAPLYIEAIVSHPSPETQIPLPDGDGLRPAILDADGEEVDAEFVRLLEQSGTSPAGQPLRFAWSVDAELAAGPYQVELSLPDDYPHQESSISGVEIEPAWIEIADGATTAAQNDRYARRALAIEGKHDQLVAELRTLIKAKPDELSLRVELADALDGAGNAAAAEKELLAYGYRLQQQSGQDWEMPDWLVFRLSDLHAKANPPE